MKKVYFLLLTVLVAVSAWSKTTSWTGGGTNKNWDNSQNWDNGIPADGDIVIISTNASLTIVRVAADQADNILTLNSLSILGISGIVFQTIGSGGGKTITITNGGVGNDLVIDAGSQLTLDNNMNVILSTGAGAGISGRLNVNANRTYTSNGVTTLAGATAILNNSGIVTSPAASNLVFQNAAAYIHAQNGGNIPNATWDITSRCAITGVNNTVPTGLSQTFGNFIWNSSQTGDIDLNGSLINVAGDLTISKTSGQPAVRLLNFTTATDFTLTVGGNLIIEQPSPGGTNVYFVNDGDGDAIINVAGNYNHKSGNLGFVDVNASANDGTSILHLSGNLLQSGGDINFTNGDDGPPGQKGSMTMEGNFSQTGGTMRTTVGDPEVLNGLITFEKTGVQTFKAVTPGNVSYINFIIAGGTTLKLESGLLISRDIEPNWIGKFTVNAGAALDASTFVIGSQITPDVIPAASAFANTVVVCCAIA